MRSQTLKEAHIGECHLNSQHTLNCSIIQNQIINPFCPLPEQRPIRIQVPSPLGMSVKERLLTALVVAQIIETGSG
jgi:hypothetical protein